SPAHGGCQQRKNEKDNERSVRINREDRHHYAGPNEISDMYGQAPVVPRDRPQPENNDESYAIGAVRGDDNPIKLTVWGFVGGKCNSGDKSSREQRSRR